jgi:hypothetical protein
MPVHYESNPLIPHTTAGRAAYFAGTAALVLASAYFAHKTKHSRLEKLILWGAIGVEAYASTRSWTNK